MNWYKLAEKLKDVTLKGKLKQANNGFVYLSINDKLMEGLFQLIDKDKIQKPPYNQKKYNNVGTHISVMYEDETNDLNIREIGKEFNFKLGELKSVNPKTWKDMKTVYFIQVYSEELEKLRQKYGLSKKLNGQEFHITVAVEKKYELV